MTFAVVVVARLVEGSATAETTTSSERDVVVPTASADVVVTIDVLRSTRTSCCWVAEHDAATNATAHPDRNLTDKV
jgi:hypothetical protein